MIRNSFAILFASELFASVVGFGVMVTLARRLGPAGFANFEYGSAVLAWWLVVVRGGFDAIVYREAARRPRLIVPLTDVLLGLRLASAVVGLMAIFTLAWASGSERRWVVAMAGLVLIPSAFATDVGFRASCRFRPLALAQVVRAIGLAVGAALFVSGTADALIAASCLVGSEIVSTIVFISIHCDEYGSIWPRFRRRVWSVLATRGAIAGVTRFGRVSLYAVDLLILGSLADSTTLGPYAAARRVAFALLALGLVVPSALAPRFAKAWTLGAVEARSVVMLTFERMSIIILPATLGLILTADRWMSCLFGDSFREGGPWLALIAARLPFVLVSNVQQAALIACRREDWSLRLVLGMVALALVVIPPLAMVAGAWGVAWGILGVEASGAIAGWFALSRLGLAPRWHHSSGLAWMGCIPLVLICSIGHEWPLASVVLAGALAYGLVVALPRDQRRLGWQDGSRKLSPMGSGGPS